MAGAATEPVRVSVIVPVYNAQAFVTDAMRELLAQLATMQPGVELIVVDDGSSDRTPALLSAALANPPVPVRTLRHVSNRGKGAAIRRGMRIARGAQCVFLDADLAYPPAEIERICTALSGGADVAIACRVHPQSQYIIRPSFFRYLYTRHLAGRLFNWLVRLVLLPGIRDTQAGLKGFTAAAAPALFGGWLPRGFSFDLAVLFRAQRSGLAIEQVPVLYRYESEPTTVRFLLDTLLVLRDLVRIRLRLHGTGDEQRWLAGSLGAQKLKARLTAILELPGTASVLGVGVTLAVGVLLLSRLVLPHGGVACAAWVVSLAAFALLALQADLQRGPFRLPRIDWKELGLLAVIVAGGAVLRLVRLGQTPAMIHNDSAWCGLLGLAFLRGEVADPFDFSPWYFTSYLSFVPYAASFALWGHSIFALRFPCAILGIATLIALYLLVRGWFGQRVAVIASTLFALSHAAIHFSRIGLWNIQVLFCGVAAFALLDAGLRRRAAVLAAGAGIFSGLALYSYTAGRLIVVVAVLFLTVRLLQRQRRALLAPAAYFAAGALLTAFPLLSNYAKDPAVFEFDRTASVWVLAEINRPHIEATLGVTSPVAVIGEQVRRTFAGFVSLGDASGQYGTAQPLLSPLTATVALAGLLLVLWRIREPPCLLLTLWTALGLLFGSVLILDPPSYTRLLVLLPVPHICAAIAVDAGWRRALARPFHVPRTVLAMAALLFIAQSAAFDLAGYRRFGQTMANMSREWDVVKVFERLRGDYDYYLFTGPFLLADSSILRLFSGAARRVNGFTEADVPDRLARDAAFIFTPEFRRVGMAISEGFPAVERDVQAEGGSPQVVVYRCTVDNGCRRGGRS